MDFLGGNVDDGLGHHGDVAVLVNVVFLLRRLHLTGIEEVLAELSPCGGEELIEDCHVFELFIELLS